MQAEVAPCPIGEQARDEHAADPERRRLGGRVHAHVDVREAHHAPLPLCVERFIARPPESPGRPRTDPDAKPPHAGIGMFIVPMDTPGISIKPATTMVDGSFANIFYDDVRIPAEKLVGPLDGGWKVLTDALANERGTVGGGDLRPAVQARGFDDPVQALGRP